MIEWYWVEWGFMQQGGTRWQHGAQEWHAIRKSLGTSEVWFLMFRLERFCDIRCFPHVLLVLAYVVYHSLAPKCGCREYFKIFKQQWWKIMYVLKTPGARREEIRIMDIIIPAQCRPTDTAINCIVLCLFYILWQRNIKKMLNCW